MMRAILALMRDPRSPLYGKTGIFLLPKTTDKGEATRVLRAEERKGG